ALADSEPSRIGALQPVRGRGCEVAFDQVRRRRGLRILPRGAVPPATTQERALPALLAHQPLDPLTPDVDAVTAQLPPHPVRPVRAPLVGPDVVDVAQQPAVDHLPVTGQLSLLQPAVVDGLFDIQDPKQERDCELVTVFADEPHDRRRVEPSSWAKYTLRPSRSR